jgi:hypothetical protein
MRRMTRAAALLIVLALAVGASSAGAATSDKFLTASGNVSKLDAAERTVYVNVEGSAETRFVWTADTKINGTLAPGAKVTIRYTTLPDGQNLAHQITVSKN